MRSPSRRPAAAVGAHDFGENADHAPGPGATVRAFRLVGLSLVAILGLALLAAWIVPQLLDWNRYRGEIAELVSEKLGRPVRIDGDISLTLLPQPILTASRISVAEGEDHVSIELAEMRLRLALGPLLASRIDAQELELRGLDVHLPWPFNPDPLALRAPTWLASLSARIEAGRLTIGTVAVTNIAATLGTIADTGSYALAGQAQISGQAWHLTARLSRPGSDGSAGLDLSLDGQGPMQGLGGAFTGQIAPDGTLGGRVSGRGPDLSRLLPAPAVPFRADGRLSVAGGLAIADELAIEMAGSPARGTLALRLAPVPRLDLSLAASRLDLDSWLPSLLRTATASAPLAARIPTGIDLSAEAATLAGGTLRSLRGRFDIAPNRVSLNDVTAILPGEAQLHVSGTAQRVVADGNLGARVQFSGPASLTAPNLRTTLAWLASSGFAAVADLPSGVLRTADLRGMVAAEGGPTPRIGLSGIEGQIDGSTAHGAIMLKPAIGSGSRLGVSGEIGFDRVELDPWLVSLAAPLTSLPSRLAHTDLDLRLSAAQAILLGHELTQASVGVASEPGKIILRQAEATTMGVHVTALGSLQEGGRLGDMRLELQAGTEQLGPAIASWVPGLSAFAARLPRDPVSLTVSGGGPPEALSLRAGLDIGDLHFEAQPLLNLPGLALKGARWNTQVTLRHPGAPRLFDAIGLPGTAAWLGDGSLSLVATLAGVGDRITVDSFDLSAGGLRANGNLLLDRAGTPTLSGRIAADTLPLPLPYPRSRELLPTELLAGVQASLKIEAAHVLFGLSPVLDQATATVSLANSALHIDGITATLDHGSLTGRLALDAAPPSPVASADFSLAGASLTNPLFDLPLDISGGQQTAEVHLTASGHSPEALLSTLSGSVKLSAKGAELVGVSLDAIDPKLSEPNLRAALAGGTTPTTQINLSATLKTGALTLANTDIIMPNATASLTGLIDITGRTNELRLVVHPNVPDAPEIALRLSGNLDKPQRTPELAAATAWRAAHP